MTDDKRASRRREDLYSPAAVRALFAEMSATYGLVNLVTSFGFALRWRRECVRRVDIQPGHTVYDLMTGMGECLREILAQSRGVGRVQAVDFCFEMCARARATASRLGIAETQSILEEDVLETSLASGSADRIVCSFGLKP